MMLQLPSLRHRIHCCCCCWRWQTVEPGPSRATAVSSPLHHLKCPTYCFEVLEGLLELPQHKVGITSPVVTLVNAPRHTTPHLLSAPSKHNNTVHVMLAAAVWHTCWVAFSAVSCKYEPAGKVYGTVCLQGCDQLLHIVPCCPTLAYEGSASIALLASVTAEPYSSILM